MRRYRWGLSAVLLAVIVAAFVAQRAGRGAVGKLVFDWRARRRPLAAAKLPEITSAEADEVRGERDRGGEVAAVKRLRTLHPTLSLLDAKDLAREL